MNEKMKDIIYTAIVYFAGLGVGYALSAGKKEEVSYSERITAQASVIGRCVGWWREHDDDTGMNIYRCEGLASRLDSKPSGIPPVELEARAKVLQQCVEGADPALDWQAKLDKCEDWTKRISQ